MNTQKTLNMLLSRRHVSMWGHKRLSVSFFLDNHPLSLPVFLLLCSEKSVAFYFFSPHVWQEKTPVRFKTQKMFNPQCRKNTKAANLTPHFCLIDDKRLKLSPLNNNNKPTRTCCHQTDMQLCNPSSFFCVFYSYPIVMPSWTLEHMNVFANRSCKSKLERVSVDVFTADDTRHEHSVDKKSVQLCKTSSFYDCSFATMPSRTPSLHKTQ